MCLFSKDFALWRNYTRQNFLLSKISRIRFSSSFAYSVDMGTVWQACVIAHVLHIFAYIMCLCCNNTGMPVSSTGELGAPAYHGPSSSSNPRGLDLPSSTPSHVLGIHHVALFIFTCAVVFLLTLWRFARFQLFVENLETWKSQGIQRWLGKSREKAESHVTVMWLGCLLVAHEGNFSAVLESGKCRRIRSVWCCAILMFST